MKQFPSVCLFAALAVAAPLSMALATEREAMGEDARNWIDLQVSGEAAERPADGMPGEIAERVWQRYIDSFTHPIPERFERDSFVDSGN